jgi:glycosyltransferase involved in cell wall biosynthesis
MSEPRVSVLMGVFNGQRFVARAVASVLAQTLTDLELIVVNDGSTDSTGRILRAFRDPRIRVIEHENRGLTCALNEAAALARGRWLARQDADDISLATRLERQVAFLDVNLDVKLMGSTVFMSNSRGIFNEIFQYPESDREIRRAFPILNPFCHGAVVVERALFEHTGGYDERYRYAQDYELWSRLLPRCQAANHPVPLYGRVRHGGTTESTVDKESVCDAVRARARIVHPELFDQMAPDAFPIRTRDAYPIVAWPAALMPSLARTYWRMARVLHACSLPSAAESALSFFYCPWWPIRATN